MFRVFYGENRDGAERQIRDLLGEDCEVLEGENLTPQDLPSIFQGTSLFGTEKRRILLKNLTENSEVWAKIVDYVETEHEIVAWEAKIDKRSVTYKKLKEAGVLVQEFPALVRPETNLVFGVFDLALKDGVKAVAEVEKVEAIQDPYMFFGLLVTQALKKFEWSKGAARERRILKELAELDLQMKSSTVEPWLLVKAFLMRLGTL